MLYRSLGRFFRLKALTTISGSAFYCQIMNTNKRCTISTTTHDIVYSDHLLIVDYDNASSVSRTSEI